MIEDNGITCIDDDVLLPLSAGTRAVANYRNVEYDGRFVLVDRGAVLVDFDPQTPTSRSGGDADLLAPQMSELGLTDDPGETCTQAALALTERVTGVPFTEQFLHDARFLVAAIPDPLG